MVASFFVCEVVDGTRCVSYTIQHAQKLHSKFVVHLFVNYHRERNERNGMFGRVIGPGDTPLSDNQKRLILLGIASGLEYVVTSRPHRACVGRSFTKYASA